MTRLITLIALLSSMNALADESPTYVAVDGHLERRTDCPSGKALVGLELYSNEKMDACVVIPKDLGIGGKLKQWVEMVLANKIENSVEAALLRYGNATFTGSLDNGVVTLGRVTEMAE